MKSKEPKHPKLSTALVIIGLATLATLNSCHKNINKCSAYQSIEIDNETTD